MVTRLVLACSPIPGFRLRGRRFLPGQIRPVPCGDRVLRLFLPVLFRVHGLQQQPQKKPQLVLFLLWQIRLPQVDRSLLFQFFAVSGPLADGGKPVLSASAERR